MISNIRVLQVLPALFTGGVERGTVDIDNALVKHKCHSMVASSGGKLVSQLSYNGKNHVKLPLYTKNPVMAFYNALKLIKIIKEHKINIIHARSRMPAWSALYAARKAGIAFVTTFHGVYSDNFPGKKFYNSVMTKGDVVIAVSEFVKKHILTNYNIPEDKICVIPRGVDVDKYDIDNVKSKDLADLKHKFRLVQNKPIILLPGRFSGWKGHRLLIESLKNIDKEFYCLFTIEPNEGKNLINDIDIDNELKSKLRFIGNVSDMVTLYGLADIIVAPSMRPEAFGRISIEAQAMGKTLVASNIGGSLETIINGKTGWLFESGNVKDLSNILNKLLSSNLQFNKRARRHIIENFSLRQMSDSTIDIYRDLI